MTVLACRWLWTGSEEAPLENVRLQLRDGRISEISPGSGGEHFVMPAFVDAHCHFTQMARFAAALDLSGAGCAADVLAAVARSASGGEGIIHGERFDESGWSDPRLPTPDQLDAAAGGRPVFLRRVCCHMAVMSNAMMDLYEEGAPGIDRDTGVAVEGPVLEFDRRFAPSGEDLAASLRYAAAEAGAAGVTGVCTMERLEDARRLRDTDLGLDVSSAVLAGDLDRLEADEGMLGVKCFLDGSVGARTAAMEAPWTSGEEPAELLYEDRELTGLLVRAWRLGLPPVMHAIGGRAVRQAARCSREAVKTAEVPERLAWARLEHAEELGEEAMSELDPSLHRVCAQPNFVSAWQHPGGLYAERLGWDAARAMNPFARLLERGVGLGFGSDGMPFGPLAGLDGAVRHPHPRGRLTVGQALRAYTLDAAAVSGMEGLARPLEAGRRADLAVLSDSPFRRGGFSGIEVVAAYRRGRQVAGGGRGPMAS